LTPLLDATVRWGDFPLLSEGESWPVLVPILTRAESLFHRFERSVQAIDKKDNFPTAPTVESSLTEIAMLVI
jgi:hypothetical protein